MAKTNHIYRHYPDIPEYVCIREIADIFRISENSARKIIKESNIEYRYDLLGKRVYSKNDVLGIAFDHTEVI